MFHVQKWKLCYLETFAKFQFFNNFLSNPLISNFIMSFCRLPIQFDTKVILKANVLKGLIKMDTLYIKTTKVSAIFVMALRMSLSDLKFTKFS